MDVPPFIDPQDDFSLDPRQREIRELLTLVGPEPATFFADACRIMDGAAGVTTQTHLAAHLLREIEGRLHEVFSPMLSREAKERIAEAGKNEESTRPLVQELAAVRGPTKGHLKRLRNRVPHSTVILGEFFAAAQLAWFPLLREDGYFENPPPLEADDEGRVAYVEWPAARFLVRAAAVEDLQIQVVEILKAVETNNSEARDATVEAAVAMPAARAAQLVTKIAS
jgi:hypothetical protein